MDAVERNHSILYWLPIEICIKWQKELTVDYRKYSLSRKPHSSTEKKWGFIFQGPYATFLTDRIGERISGRTIQKWREAVKWGFFLVKSAPKRVLPGLVLSRFQLIYDFFFSYTNSLGLFTYRFKRLTPTFLFPCKAFSSFSAIFDGLKWPFSHLLTLR